MLRYTFIFILTLVNTIPVAFAADVIARFKDGQLLKVKGKKDYKIVDLAGDDDFFKVGFPAFKDWSVKYDESASIPLLEATVISTNTGIPVQNARVYVEYEGSAPSLFAISDADGRIKMRIQYFMDSWSTGENGVLKRNGQVKLVRIYIGNPNQEGSNTRVYNVSKPDKNK